MDASFLNIALALFYSFSYVKFHIHSVFSDVSLLSGLHISTVTGEYLLS